jgi:SAM-dependent methyltransferase
MQYYRQQQQAASCCNTCVSANNKMHLACLFAATGQFAYHRQQQQQAASCWKLYVQQQLYAPALPGNQLNAPSQRALELLALPPDGTPRLLLDIGCGSGLSGEALTEAGHNWLGLDISAAMLDVAVEREVSRAGSCEIDCECERPAKLASGFGARGLS